MTGEEKYRKIEHYVRSNSKKVRGGNGGILTWACFFCGENNPSASMKMGRKSNPITYCSHCGRIYNQLAKGAGIWEENKYIPKQQYINEKYGIRYNYQNIKTGEHTHFKFRIPKKDGGKSFNQGDYDTEGNWIGNLDNIDTSLSIFCNDKYGKLMEAIKNKEPVSYCEGEKDCITLWNNNCVSFTSGGASGAFKEAILPFLTGGNFVVFGDNDPDGIKSADKITTLLNTIGNAITIIPPDVPKKGDITDYAETHSKEDLQALLKSAVDSLYKNTVKEKDTKSLQLPAQAQSEQIIGSTETNIQVINEKPINHNNFKKPSKMKQIKNIISLLVKYEAAKNYSTTDKGSGALFADIFKDKHRYNPEWKDFAYYNGKKWAKDIEGMEARRSAKMLVDALFQYTSQANLDEKEQGNYYKFICRLTQLKNRNAMINDSKDKYYFCNNDLDKDNFLLNCQNGVLNLKNKEIEFIEHDADLLLSKICNVKYDPTATCKNWEKFLDEVMLQDKEKIKYLQKIAGISLTGDTKEETMFILYGATTRNGKSTFVETIIYLLGDYATTIQPETLATKNNKDSRQANGDIAKLKGIRFVNASEPKKRMILDTALLKALTGGDTITARNLYEREFEFSPIFKLVVNTNYLPQITDDTVFSSGRINIISFERHFEPEEQDKNLKNKLKDEHELSGILNWCIEGLKLYRKEGLEPPQTVKSATSDYRQQSDKIGNFINECLEKTGKNSKAKDIYEVYIKWCEDNGYGCENKGNFFSELKGKNLFATTGTINGKTYRNIVKGYEIAFTESEENVPFD